MSAEQAKAIVKRLFDEFYNGGKVDVADEIFAAEVTLYDAGVPVKGGPAVFKQRQHAQLAATPDFHMTLEDVIVEGDKAAYRWTMRGTHTGPMRGIPPTGKSIAMSGMTILRIDGGKIVEGWHNYDMLGLLQQLGVIPMPGQGGR